MAPEAGLEPATSSLTGTRATIAPLWNEAGRNGEIRTRDFLHPKQALYRAELRSVEVVGPVVLNDMPRGSACSTLSYWAVKVVGMTGVEPATSASQTQRSAGLSYIPNRQQEFPRGTVGSFTSVEGRRGNRQVCFSCGKVAVRMSFDLMTFPQTTGCSTGLS